MKDEPNRAKNRKRYPANVDGRSTLRGFPGPDVPLPALGVYIRMQVPSWITNLKEPGSLWGTIVGWACICVGIAGLILPVIPGLAFLGAGLLILSTRYRWASFCLRWLKRQARKVRARRVRRKEEDSELVTTQSR